MLIICLRGEILYFALSIYKTFYFKSYKIHQTLQRCIKQSLLPPLSNLTHLNLLHILAKLSSLNIYFYAKICIMCKIKWQVSFIFSFFTKRDFYSIIFTPKAYIPRIPYGNTGYRVYITRFFRFSYIVYFVEYFVVQTFFFNSHMEYRKSVHMPSGT